MAAAALIGCGARAIPPLRSFLLQGRPRGIYQPRQLAVETLGQLGAKDVLLEYLNKPLAIKDPVVRHSGGRGPKHGRPGTGAMADRRCIRLSHARGIGSSPAGDRGGTGHISKNGGHAVFPVGAGRRCLPVVCGRSNSRPRRCRPALSHGCGWRAKSIGRGGDPFEPAAPPMGAANPFGFEGCPNEDWVEVTRVRSKRTIPRS